MKVWLFFQIALTILSALFAGSALLTATWFGFEWGVVFAGLTLVCFMIVKICKLHTDESGVQSQADGLELKENENEGLDLPIEEQEKSENEKDGRK